MRPMGPGGMMQLGRIRCLWRLMALVVCDADGVTLSKSRMARYGKRLRPPRPGGPPGGAGQLHLGCKLLNAFSRTIMLVSTMYDVCHCCSIFATRLKFCSDPLFCVEVLQHEFFSEICI